MFGAVLTAAFSVLLLYVAWRATSVPLVARRISRTRVAVVGVLLWVVFVLGRFFGHDGTGVFARALETFGMCLLGSLFIVSMPLLAVDLFTCFGRLFSRWAASLRGWALVAGCVLSGIALVQGLRAPAVVSHDVTLPSLPAELDGKVLVAMSDAHLGTLLDAGWFSDRIADVRRLRPDLLVFLGDMFEGHGDPPRDLPALRQLRAPLGKWFVNGNHESQGDAGAGAALLEQAGFRRLASQWAEPAPGLVLAGVDDLSHHRRHGRDGDPLGRALGGRPTGATVLLSHTPWQADRAARAGVELMLSGHTHGGQIWPWGYLVKTIYPLLAGRYDVDGMPVIVCRGTGTWGPRMRLWHRGEILKVTLHASARSP
jgi:uncharacterized protein